MPNPIEKIQKISDSSMRVVLAKTETGEDIYVKPFGGCRDGHHPLICEWVGSQLAKWFGLPIPPFSILNIENEDVEMIKYSGGIAQEGPAFCSRAIPQCYSWAGDKASLIKLENPEIIAAMVVFDTWTLNWDRKPPEGDGRNPNYDNVLITKHQASKNKLRIFPIDFGECFSKARTLSPKISTIERTKSNKIYGFFPAFKDFVTKAQIDSLVDKLRLLEKQEVRKMITSIPREWEIDTSTQNSLYDLIVGRAAFLESNIQDMIFGGKK